MIPYGRQHITESDISAVVEVLKSPFLTQGPKIKEFEEKFAHYIGANYAVAAANGTAALHLSCLALGVKPGDKVLTTPLTFASSANCVLYCGGSVEFADINPDTLLLDIGEVRRKLEAAPKGTYKGIIPVDFAGYPVDLQAFRELADEFGCWILEDACHAPGGYFMDNQGNEQRCGNGRFANLAIFSFHPVKHIATGEGGMVTTQDSELYEKLKLYRTHGITRDPNLMTENHGGWYYEMQELGANYRISDIHCALGISQLARADEGLRRRQEIAQRYNEAFLGTEIKPVKVPQEKYHAYHLYVVQVPNRKLVYDQLQQQNIFPQIHYIPLHLMPYYQQLGWKKGDFPHVEAYYEHCLSLPLYPTLSIEEQEFVINTLHDICHADTKTSVLIQ